MICLPKFQKYTRLPANINLYNNSSLIKEQSQYEIQSYRYLKNYNT